MATNHGLISEVTKKVLNAKIFVIIKYAIFNEQTGINANTETRDNKSFFKRLLHETGLR